MEEIYIQTPFNKLAALTWGDKKKQPILAIHGWLDNAASFESLAPFFCDHYLIAIDLPGHGKSEHRSCNATYHFANWVREIYACAQQLKLEKFSMIGHSMGASIACFTAGIFPEMVQQLFLIEGLGPLTDDAEKIPKRLRQHIEQTLALENKEAPIYPDLAELIEKRQKVGKLPRQAAEKLIKRGVKEVENGFIMQNDPRLRLASPTRFSEEQVISVLKQISCPTTLIVAESGIPYNKEGAKRRLDAIKNCQLVTIPGGHHVHMETPQKVAEIFLKGNLQ